MPHGYFITFEGVDGGGKTTQLERLAAALRERGLTVVTTREPGGTATAEQIRRVVLDKDLVMGARTELLLYLAARAEHVEHVIRPALAAGHVVLCDRFADSTLVYQGVVRGLPLDEVERLCRFAAEGVTPDRTILLDADPRALLARRADRQVEDRLEQEGLVFQEKVREGFLALWRRHGSRICRIDALRPADAVTRDILAALAGGDRFPRKDTNHV